MQAGVSYEPGGSRLYYGPASDGEAAGPHHNDVRQGQIGDCFLLSSLSAVAMSDPDRIRQMIQPLSDNRFRVRFWVLNERGFVHHDEFVTAAFPTRHGNPVYGQSDDGPIEIWVSVVERAYAQWGGGYGEIEGGHARFALEEITGIRATDYAPANMTEEQILVLIDEAIGAGHPVVAGTGTETSEELDQLSPSHAYSVIRVEPSARTVIVRNPHLSARGEQSVPIATFRRAFTSISQSHA